MNVTAIVCEIDAEIEKLQKLRKVLAGLWNVCPKETTNRERKKRAPRPVISPEPTLTVLPPRVKREYRPRIKPFPREQKALAPPISDKPVFVPRSATPTLPDPRSRSNDSNVESIETAVRRNLLGGAA
jgi:hypothetical protein